MASSQWSLSQTPLETCAFPQEILSPFPALVFSLISYVSSVYLSNSQTKQQMKSRPTVILNNEILKSRVYSKYAEYCWRNIEGMVNLSKEQKNIKGDQEQV